MPASVFTEAYGAVIARLTALRKAQGVSQVELARRLGKTQQFISYVETCERRIDIIEFYAIVCALGADPVETFATIVGEFPANVDI